MKSAEVTYLNDYRPNTSYLLHELSLMNQAFSALPGSPIQLSHSSNNSVHNTGTFGYAGYSLRDHEGVHTIEAQLHKDVLEPDMRSVQDGTAAASLY